MVFRDFFKKYENIIWASAALAALLLLTAVRYDYYYDLNDDVVIKDLMAGVYTGEPEGHNIQILYPLSLAISLFYRAFPQAPVYGIFLCLCQYGCLWLMMHRSLRFCQNTAAKICMAAGEAVMVWGLLLEHLVFVQYTFTSALLSAAAAFLFVTAGQEGAEKTAGEFIRKNIPSILLAILSFQLRTEMMELLLPMICGAGVYRWSLEGKIFTRENCKKYFAIFGGVLAGMLLSLIVDRAAFRGEEWGSYVDFFNSRTELYDFQGIPPYEGNEELYGQLGLEKSGQYMLLEEYNFGLEDRLDAASLDQLAGHQKRVKASGLKAGQQLREKLWGYLHRIWPSKAEELSARGIPCDYPWNVMVILGYGAVLLTAMGNGEGRGRKPMAHIAEVAGCLLLLFVVRTGLWMFILWRDRAPVRITHSLYLMEFCILAAMIWVEGRGRKAGEGLAFGVRRPPAGRRLAISLAFVSAAVLMGTAALALPKAVEGADKEYGARAVANEVYDGMRAYAKAHDGSFYFIDVYSAVSYPSGVYQGTPYSEKMFAGVDNGLANYDIMGGWLVKSPSHRKKLQRFGIESIEEGLLDHEEVYLMAELEKGTKDFEDYFREKGVTAHMERIDEIGGMIGVYRISAER